MFSFAFFSDRRSGLPSHILFTTELNFRSEIRSGRCFGRPHRLY